MSGSGGRNVRPSVEYAGAGCAQRGERRRTTRAPEHRGEAEHLADRAAREAADHPGRAVTEQGVQRLATTAEPTGKVPVDHADARAVLGRERDRMGALTNTSTAGNVPNAAVAAKRSIDTTAAIVSQACGERRDNHAP